MYRPRHWPLETAASDYCLRRAILKLIDTTYKLCQFCLMIPAFTDEGLLPPGIHWASWSEIEDRYGVNSHRQRLLSGLEKGIQLLEVALCTSVYLDGSFVTDKLFPDDFDACWEPVGVDLGALDPIFFDFRNLRAAQRARFLGEFFPATNFASLGPPFPVFLQFFQTDKNTGAAKGIVGLTLKGTT